MSKETIDKVKQESTELGRILSDPKLVEAMEKLDNKSNQEILSILADMDAYFAEEGVKLPEGAEIHTQFNKESPRRYSPLGINAPVTKSVAEPTSITGSAKVCINLGVVSGCIEVQIQ